MNAAEWNARYPIGTPVLYRERPDAEPIHTFTASRAFDEVVGAEGEPDSEYVADTTVALVRQAARVSIEKLEAPDIVSFGELDEIWRERPESEVRECDCCNFETTVEPYRREVTSAAQLPYREDLESGEWDPWSWYCDLCASTYASRKPTDPVLSTITYVGNRILEAIREQGKT